MKQYNLSHADYLQHEAVSNSELQLMLTSPSDYIWAKNAPSDPIGTGALDFGTALHTALLEPDFFNGDKFVVFDGAKSRDTVKYNNFIQDIAPDKIVILESEYNKLRLMVDSAKAHPTYAHYLNLMNERERSIIGNYKGLKVKIRPDLKNDKLGLIGDVKSTASLSDWRERVEWRNPLFTRNYGHTAAFYMDVYSEYLGQKVDKYYFLVNQKNIDKGRYPVAVMPITRDELTRYGFFDELDANINEMIDRQKTGDWLFDEPFEPFSVGDEIIL